MKIPCILFFPLLFSIQIYGQGVTKNGQDIPSGTGFVNTTGKIVTSAALTRFGQEISLPNCGTVTDIDGNTYNTISIGSQCWLQANLKTTKLNNGTVISLVTNNLAWYNLTSPGYCWYNNNEAAYKATYGALYNFYTVSTGMLCPTGWHVPSDTEWTTLENYLIDNGYNYDGTTSGNKIAKSMASTTNWALSSVAGAVGNTDYPAYRNKSGFSGLPTGQRETGGLFYDIGYHVHWWSNINAGFWNMDYYNVDLEFGNFIDMHMGFPVRCIKDELPTVITSTTFPNSSASAHSGGSIIYDGGGTIITRGVCWSTSINPTTANSKTIDGTGSGVFVSSLTGLTSNTTYYVRAYATNSVGTQYGNEISFITFPAVGDSYGGGIVAYILNSGDPGYLAGEVHGLIAAPSDQGSGTRWSTGGFSYTGANGATIGTGNSNTNIIVAFFGGGTYAAKICYDLVLGGYSDWYLPSRDELNKLYFNKLLIGGFGEALYSFYWSSSETGTYSAWMQDFSNGSQIAPAKNITSLRHVRATRTF